MWYFETSFFHINVILNVIKISINGCLVYGVMCSDGNDICGVSLGRYIHTERAKIICLATVESTDFLN